MRVYLVNKFKNYRNASTKENIHMVKMYNKKFFNNKIK